MILFHSNTNTTLCHQLAHSTGLADLLLGLLAEELCAHDHGLRVDAALAQHLRITLLGDVHDGCDVLLGGGELALLLGQQRPHHVDVDDRPPVAVVVLLHVEVTHSNLTEVSRMEAVEQNTMVVLTYSVTATSSVASVLSHTAVAGAHVSALLAVLTKRRRHCASRITR